MPAVRSLLDDVRAGIQMALRTCGFSCSQKEWMLCLLILIKHLFKYIMSVLENWKKQKQNLWVTGSQRINQKCEFEIQ